MTDLTDQELIAAVAEKLGGKKRIPDTRFPDMCVWFFEGKAYESHKLPSADACLALLDKPWAMQQFSDGNVEFTIYDPEANKTWEVIEDMEPGMSQVQVRCRAILLAILEVE